MTPVMDQELESKSLTTVQTAKGLVVTNNESRTFAAEIGRGVAALIKEAEAWFKPMKDAAKRAHSEICVKEHQVIDPLEEAKKHLSFQIGAYDQRMERERQAEENRLQEELRKQAEADAQRQADEQAIADAEEFQALGDDVGAEAVLNNPVPQPVYVPPVVLPSSVPKAKGVSSTQVWKFKITNPELIPREYLIPDEQLLGQLARALKDKMCVPGVQPYSEASARFRA